MSKVYDAMVRAQRDANVSEREGTLRARMRAWVPRRRADVVEEPRRDPVSRAEVGSSPDADVDADAEIALPLRQELASLKHTVEALDARLAGEFAEREAKHLEEIRTGMRGLQNDLSDRFVAAAAETRQTVRLGVSLVVVLVAGLSGMVVAVLSLQ